SVPLRHRNPEFNIQEHHFPEEGLNLDTRGGNKAKKAHIATKKSATRKTAASSFKRVSDYPKAINGYYTGEKNLSNFPTLLAGVCSKRLGLEGRVHMRAMLVHQINAACITQSFFTMNGYKEKWALLMNQLATSEYLPNEVKGALEIVVKDRKWNREARYYWHALDSFTIHTMKNL